jgi:hypothetical protein
MVLTMGEGRAIVPGCPAGALLHLPAYVRTVTSDETAKRAWRRQLPGNAKPA